MQEAFKVVSSPRWQTQNTDDKTADKTNAVETTGTSPASDDTAAANTLSADTADTAKAEISTADDTASTYENDETRDTDRVDDSTTMTGVDDPEATSTATATRAYEPPTVMQTAKSPLLALTAACASAAALWSYTTLEDTRAQLANVSSAKATLERSLSEAQSKLTAAEKTVADVKAAIGAATAATAKTSGSTATK